MDQRYLLHDFAAEPLPACGIIGADPVMHREARVMRLKNALREPRRASTPSVQRKSSFLWRRASRSSAPRRGRPFVAMES